MKVSKYSKRRPASGLVIAERDIGKRITSAAITTSRRTVSSKQAAMPNNYDVVIFLDDVRNPREIYLPPHSRLEIARNLEEFKTVLNNELENELIDTIFISFDHYLDERQRVSYTGETCLVELLFAAEPYAGKKRIDITGHSSDHAMNKAKARIYAVEGSNLGRYFDMGRG